jgi:hypothetical protein
MRKKEKEIKKKYMFKEKMRKEKNGSNPRTQCNTNSSLTDLHRSGR